jgi:hypothetical protein
MATLGQTNVAKVFADGDSDQVALYALRNVTTGDTINTGPGGLGDFLGVKQAVVLGTTVAGIANPTIAGTTLTMPAGLAADAGYMLVWGPSGSMPS